MLTKLGEVLRFDVAIPERYIDAVFPVHQQVMGAGHNENLHDAAAVLSNINQIQDVLNRNTGKILLNMRGDIIQPSVLLSNLHRKGLLRDEETMFNVIILFFRQRRQIRHFRFLPDTLNQYLVNSLPLPEFFCDYIHGS